MDKYSGYLGESLCTIASMEDPVCGGSIGLTTALSPATGPAKRQAAAHCVAGKTRACAKGGLVGFMLKAHLW